MRYILGGYNDSNGNYTVNLYEGNEGYSRFICDTFQPDCDATCITLYAIGDSYAKRKSHAREIVKAVQEMVAKGNLTYGELSIVGTQLEKMARRYGLIREFRENGII